MLKLVGPLAAIALAGLLMMTVVLVALLAKVSTDPSRPIQVVLGAATPIPSLNEPPAFSAAYAERGFAPKVHVESKVLGLNQKSVVHRGLKEAKPGPSHGVSADNLLAMQ